MIVTTTNNIENSKILKYIDLISTNVVIGTNFFSDFGAGLTDLFGGYSDTYQNKLQKIYGVAIINLKNRAQRIGANAVIGLRLDFDEISGKGKSMFMVSASGTAVSIEEVDSNKFQIDKTDSLVYSSQLENEITKRIIIHQSSQKILPNQKEWMYLLNNPIDEILESLISTYLDLSGANVMLSEKETLLNENLSEYLKIINQEVAINTLYSKLLEHTSIILKLLKENKLFSPRKILDLINNDNLKIALDCLNLQKEYYTQEDLNIMQIIVEKLNNLPETGKIEITKDGLLSKEKERFVCQNGHKNDLETKFCSNENCQIDIRGLTKSDNYKINLFKLKMNSLEFLLKDKFTN